ncbi:hypothetical protein F7725_011242 [Dissostichus mawsoni]|uniref:AGC-kinase C-terminal domain-containing protein n=1 Tax=Dissostichus mawsoni TaxID=36200 RepID=A0A7J5ZA60_DISMA|nr:hypothetical protein F7725_011242 [Dissostichus mawsoni]
MNEQTDMQTDMQWCRQTEFTVTYFLPVWSGAPAVGRSVWSLEQKQVVPPFKPNISGEFGLDNFDAQFTNEPSSSRLTTTGEATKFFQGRCKSGAGVRLNPRQMN